MGKINKKIIKFKNTLTVITFSILSVCIFLFTNFYNINYKVTPLNELIQNTNTKNNKTTSNVPTNNLYQNNLSEDIMVADLQNMKISIFKAGVFVKEFDIISKGKPGSYYETPAGNYVIKGKYGNKFSNLGQVYMPYAMQFYGNFFIHGIPYHSDGTRVSSSYSGGCIRLSDTDAKEIYNFSNTNTRLMILNNSISNAQNNLEVPSQEKSKNILIVLTALEVVNQEKYVTFNNKKIQIKELNKLITENNLAAIKITEDQLGTNNFTERKLEKLNAVGLADLKFNLESDRVTFYNYVKNNKSYILTLLN